MDWGNTSSESYYWEVSEMSCTVFKVLGRGTLLQMIQTSKTVIAHLLANEASAKSVES
jgi:hypothetical protein